MTPARTALTLAAWGALLVLPACAQFPGASAPETGSCNAGGAQSALGQRALASVAERARVAAGARSVRFIRHDEMVTKEFDTSRLNLQLDEQGLVSKVYCG
jgi:hypothetical protein